jgi:hypothetical protein
MAELAKHNVELWFMPTYSPWRTRLIATPRPCASWSVVEFETNTPFSEAGAARHVLLPSRKP